MERACVGRGAPFSFPNEPAREASGGTMARLAVCAVIGFVWERERISDEEVLR